MFDPKIYFYSTYRKVLPKTVKRVCACVWTTIAMPCHAMIVSSSLAWNLANLAVFKLYVFIKWNISHNVFSIELSWLLNKRKQAPKTFIDVCTHSHAHTRGYICNVSCPVISSHQYFVRFIISIDNIKYVRGVNCCWISTSISTIHIGREREGEREIWCTQCENARTMGVREGGRERWGQKLVVMWHCTLWHATGLFLANSISAFDRYGWIGFLVGNVQLLCKTLEWKSCYRVLSYKRLAICYYYPIHVAVHILHTQTRTQTDISLYLWQS